MKIVIQIVSKEKFPYPKEKNVAHGGISRGEKGEIFSVVLIYLAF